MYTAMRHAGSSKGSQLCAHYVIGGTQGVHMDPELGFLCLLEAEERGFILDDEAKKELDKWYD